MPELDLEEVLRDLPRPSFKQRLKERLMDPQTVTPYITAIPVDDLADFVKETFGAEELVRATGSAGGTHYSLRIGDSMLMMGGGAALSHPPMPTMLHMYVPHVDDAHRRAVAAGCKELKPPRDQEYGDRDSVVEDLAGNQWCLATSHGPHYRPERMRTVTAYLHPFGVRDLIEFMRQALGISVIEEYAAPDGTIAHAKVQLGNTIIEMGEAHAEWTPMPTMMHVNVADSDAAYERAIAAGAKSIMPPADQRYGPRMSAVEDPTGNQWYFAGPSRKIEQ